MVCAPITVGGQCALFMISMPLCTPLLISGGQCAFFWSICPCVHFCYSVVVSVPSLWPICMPLLLSGGHWWLVGPLYGQYVPLFCSLIVSALFRVNMPPCCSVIVSAPFTVNGVYLTAQLSLVVSVLSFWSIYTSLLLSDKQCLLYSQYAHVYPLAAHWWPVPPFSSICPLVYLLAAQWW